MRDLSNCGVDTEKLRLESVHTKNKGGTFTKSSSATYVIRIAETPVNRVADVIGVVTSQNNARLRHVEWLFPDENKLRQELRQRCLTLAVEQAQECVQVLGVSLVGIYETAEEWQGIDSERNVIYFRGYAEGGKARANVSEEQLGFAVSHAERVQLNVTVRFRVSQIGEN